LKTLLSSIPAVLILLLSPPAHATEIGTPAHKFGLGLVVGSPSGLTGKYYTGGRRNAIEGTVAVSPGYHGPGGGIYLHGVYLWHPSVLATEPGFVLPWHAGVGAFLADNYDTWWRDWNNGTAVGARGVIGLDFDLEDIRLQISGDLALNLGVHSTWGLVYDPGISVGARYFF